jgi:hypothetical protein
MVKWICHDGVEWQALMSWPAVWCRWVDLVFLPTANRQGSSGWDMVAVCEAIREVATASGDAASCTIVDYLQARVQRVGYAYFRMHPKGRGVCAARQGGIPPFTFVEEYFGELHTGEWAQGVCAGVGVGRVGAAGKLHTGEWAEGVGFGVGVGGGGRQLGVYQ